jgi:hypothetical protein
MRAEGLLERLGGLSAAAQASVPAAYAWGVTVAPVAWSRGAPLLAKAAAVAALGAIALAVACERRWGARARAWGLWGFVLASAVTWSVAPAALGPLRIDAPRGLAGMLGWALFAFTSAAPAVYMRPDQHGPDAVRPEDAPAEPGEDEPSREMRADDEREPERPLTPRKVLAGGDVMYVAGGALFATALQMVGWRAPTAERELLVRVVSLAAGIAVLGAATEVALARHQPRSKRSPRRRLRGGMALLVTLAVLAMSGLLLTFRD